MKDKLLNSNPRFKTLFKHMENLNAIKSHDPSTDQVTLQNKNLQITTAMIQIELIETLIELDDSNKKLAKSNLILQILVLLLAVVALFL